MEASLASGPEPASHAHHQLPGATQQPTCRPGAAVESQSSEDEGTYSEQGAAQNLIQPAISPVATRMALPETPAAEKAAAMWDFLDRSVDVSLNPRLPADGRAPPTEVVSGSRIDSAPSPHTSEPEDLGPHTLRSANPGFSGRKRSSTVGGDALKKLSKALPSISMPSGLLPSIPTPSFFSSSSSKREGSQSPTRLSKPSNDSIDKLKPHSTPTSGHPSGQPSRPPSQKTYTLRRSASMESTLYNPMSRVSSYGDDERFLDVRKMTNSRLKAIMDSFDRPTFKMPQLPNMKSTSPFKPQFSADAMISPESHAGARPTTRVGSSIMSKSSTALLDTVLESLTGDVVVLGGYRGSVLRSATAPYQQLWVPVKVGLNMRKVNLEVGLDPEDEETMEERIVPSGMLKNIGPIDISRRLIKRMCESANARAGKLRVHEFSYDWRLSPARSSARFLEFLARLPCNLGDKPSGALVLAHSLGGLITRHAVNQRPELFSGVVYAGVPQRCINIIGPMRNGDAVLFNQKLLTAQVTFSFRTSFVFLPEDGFCFLSKDGKQEFKFDFYNPDNWVKYKMCPAVAPLPKASHASSKLDSALYSLRGMSATISTFDLRGRSGSDERGRKTTTNGVLMPQADDHTGAPASCDDGSSRTSSPESGTGSAAGAHGNGKSNGQYARAYRYLARTLAETKKFRAETQHRPELSAANAYPPLAIMYGKDTPTVHAVRVSSLDAIATPGDVYDDLVFRSGDGVVLAREAMLPPGYDLVSGGRISTEKGHISILGDFAGVARAIAAVLRGRAKGIGMGDDVVGSV